MSILEDAETTYRCDRSLVCAFAGARSDDAYARQRTQRAAVSHHREPESRALYSCSLDSSGRGHGSLLRIRGTGARRDGSRRLKNKDRRAASDRAATREILRGYTREIARPDAIQRSGRLRPAGVVERAPGNSKCAGRRRGNCAGGGDSTGIRTMGSVVLSLTVSPGGVFVVSGHLAREATPANRERARNGICRADCGEHEKCKLIMHFSNIQLRMEAGF